LARCIVKPKGCVLLCCVGSLGRRIRTIHAPVGRNAHAC
jgi:hypothetical protein